MATRASDLVGGDVNISEQEGAKKYLLIKVPDFDTDPSGRAGADANDPGPDRLGQKMTSYLRLGVPLIGDDIGDELIQHAYDAGPAGKEDGSPFIDDERNRGVGNTNPLGADGHGMVSADRKALFTAHLKSKGGWRDHSDGNRISTTYGDKVEVVRGNYKMVVLGRQDDPGNAMGWDCSGNHVQDYAQATMPGASVSVEWIQNAYVPNTFPATANDHDFTVNALADGHSKTTDNAALQKSLKDDAEKDVRADAAANPQNYPTPKSLTDAIAAARGDTSYGGGAWLLINSTERVYQYSRNAGNFREQQWGDKMESYVGSENPSRIGIKDDDGYQGHPNDEAYHSVAAKNYDDDQLVKRLRPSSKGLPRGNPHILERTWASKIESYTGSSTLPVPKIVETTYATDTWAETHVTNKISDKTWAGTVEEELHVTGSVTSTTVTGNVTETTTSGNIISTTTSGNVAEVTTAGNCTGVTTALSVSEVTIAAALTEVTIAAAQSGLSLVGNNFELSLGILKESIEINAGIEIYIGKKEELSFPDEDKAKTKKTHAALMEVRASLATQHTSLNQTTSALQATLRALSVQLGT